jgi:tetratricopeptide (TPR) repeat protein
MATIVHSHHDYEEAEKLYSEALEEAQAQAPGNQRTEQMCNALKGLANLSLNQQKLQDSARFYRRAADLESSNSQCDPAIKSATLNNLAIVYGYLDRKAEEEQVLKQALLLAEKSQNKEYQAKILDSLAVLYREQKNYKKADETGEKAIALAADVWQTPNLNTALMQSNRAMVLLMQGKYKQSETLLKNAVPIIEKDRGSDNALTVEANKNLAVVYLSQGKLDDAINTFGKAVDGWNSNHKESDADSQQIQLGLARAYLEKGELSKAQHLAEKVLQNDEKFFGSNSVRIQSDLVLLGTIFNQKGDSTQAMKLAQRAQVLGKNYSVFRLLAQIEYKLGKLAEANKNAHQSVLLCEQAGVSPFQLIKAYNELAEIAKAQKLYAESKIYADKAAQVQLKLKALNH